jgi:hypothetical protein
MDWLYAAFSGIFSGLAQGILSVCGMSDDQKPGTSNRCALYSALRDSIKEMLRMRLNISRLPYRMRLGCPGPVISWGH